MNALYKNIHSSQKNQIYFFPIYIVVAIILGLDIFDKDKAYYTVIGYAGFVAGVLVIMEISKFLYDRAEESIHEGKVYRHNFLKLKGDSVAKPLPKFVSF